MHAITENEAHPDAALAPSRPIGSVVDLFCGAGGLSHGFHLEGYAVKAGIDIDEDCRFAYEHNNDAPFLAKDVSALTAADLEQLFIRDEPRILVGCAPCQPFSTYNQKNDDPKWKLVEKFGELITALLPDVVSMENVPRLLNFKGGDVINQFVENLEGKGYSVEHRIVFAPDYGVPQTRSRLVLLASRRGAISLEEPVPSADGYPTVEGAIGRLAPLRRD